MYILGINAYHGDASAALVCDGKLLHAVEEERFNRVKHWAGFPAQSVQFCLRQAGIEVDDVEHVAVSFNPRANLGKKLAYTLAKRPSLSSLVDRFKRQAKSLGLREQLARACGVSVDSVKAKIHHIEHHDSHIACGFFLSPFDEAAVLSVDGMGDFVSTVSAVGKGAEFSKLHQVYYPHSLGFLYNALTIYLGFPNYGDEYKVMGLAPYGKPRFVTHMRQIVHPDGAGFSLNLDYFTHPRHGISMSWEDGSPHVDSFFSPMLEDLLGPARDAREEVTSRHEDIAASLQVVTEEILFHLLRTLHDQTRQTRLVLVGGCAMNSVAVGKITRNTPFREVYVPVGAADNGTSFGAAIDVWRRRLAGKKAFQLEHSYWGSEFSDGECRKCLEDAGTPFLSMDKESMLTRTVDALVEGKVVGWFQGRMEFGARALGNRSLLADPRRTDMRDIINLKIKFRERFRPFAPSIQEEYVPDYFEMDEASPFMERVLPIREERHDEIPAVTHVDGSGRLQSVSRQTNPLYWELIERFRQRTGVPIILNTSLNENEPIVRTPKEALDCFLRTSMDMLVLGNQIVDRKDIDADVVGERRQARA